ncbi:MAG: hypothetical protein ACK4RN_12725 [Pseudorhodobacter sp.]
MNPQLIKWIRAYQGSKGREKNPNGVIEPGDKTWNAGASNFHRYREEIENYEAYMVVEKGKERPVPVEEYIQLEIESRNTILKNAAAVQSECDVIIKLIQGLLDTQAGQQGYLNAMVSLGMSGFGLSPPPGKNAALAARAAAGAVISATDRSKVDWKKVKTLCTNCNKLHDKAVKEWTTYNKKYTKRAEWGAFGAQVVSDGAFGTLEVLATGYLVTTRGMSPKKAQVMAAMGVEGLKVSAEEIGEYAANDKFDPTASAMKVGGSMLVTGVASALGTKLSAGAMTKVTKQIVPLAKKQFNTRLQQYTYDVIVKIFTSGVGENLIKNAINEIGNTSKEVAGGKKLSEADVIAKIVKILSGSLIGSAPFKSLEKFDKNWAGRSVDLATTHFTPILNKKMTMQLVARYPRGTVDEILKQEGGKIITETAKKMTDVITGKGIEEVVKKMKGEESTADDFIRYALKGLEKDSSFTNAFETAVIEEAEKRMEKMQKAR